VQAHGRVGYRLLPGPAASSASHSTLRWATRSSACSASSAESYGPSRCTAAPRVCVGLNAVMPAGTSSTFHHPASAHASTVHRETRRCATVSHQKGYDSTSRPNADNPLRPTRLAMLADRKPYYIREFTEVSTTAIRPRSPSRCQRKNWRFPRHDGHGRATQAGSRLSHAFIAWTAGNPTERTAPAHRDQAPRLVPQLTFAHPQNRIESRHDSAADQVANLVTTPSPTVPAV